MYLLDTSFLAHALIPAQRTTGAGDALRRLVTGDAPVFMCSSTLIEFGSLIRKLTTRQQLSVTESRDLMEQARDLATTFVAVSIEDVVEGFELSVRLGQSDSFDATGYVVAQRLSASFWICDRRFANAAQSAGLSSFELFQ